MKLTKSIFAIILILAFGSSCTERIDIQTDDAPEHLSIYGYITADTTQHSIRITRSAGYFANTRPVGVSKAIVTISSGDDTLILTENDSVAGLYQTEPNTYGIPGKTYTLNVTLDFDNDGQTEQYQASSQMPFNAQLDSIALRPSKAFTDYIEILAYATLPEFSEDNTHFYSFHAFKNGVAINDSLVGFNMVDDEFLNSTKIDGVSCMYLNQDPKTADPRSIIKSGDKITLRVDVLTKDYGTFLRDAQGEVMGSIPLFSGPPANIDANITKLNASNKIPVVGYFSAYCGQKASTIVK